MDETELLKLYLELESLRFKDKFTYDIEVDEALAASSMRIPAMLIQPFVENAVHHGVNNLNGKTGLITVRLSFSGVHLLVVIEDNGIGREQALRLHGQAKSTLAQVCR